MNLVPAAPPQLHAFVDEAGVRAHTPKSSDHFIMSAVVVEDTDLGTAAQFLADLRQATGRGPGVHLHWQNFNHVDRVHAAQSLGAQPWAKVSTVVVCKRHLPQTTMNEDHFYLYTLRFLLERLSWIARDSDTVMTYTVAHIVRMRLSQLRQYEAALRGQQTQISWSALDPRGGRIDQPKNLELLSLADIAASATFSAFNLDKHGNTEERYLRSLAPRLYRRPPGMITSYGMKMHPWASSTKAAYPWVAAL
ncbi:DUF3800 domain-containing protein [Streptomyces sp. NEAU-H3]|uniref:DUF3800 domain-containing protein n=1 Tax=unclassified Streptomyces TaxID=2593676 RepID=UPI001439BF82|nr:DUF3800 domain-containing protein [Streptomyces sp. NEAU-H3]NJA55075.1 DUF3800 domain-containing protein [Streptomyces sp. NEAU-H3]